MSLDFSETYKYTGPPPVFSPDGRHVATAVEYRLVVRDAETLQVVTIASCLDRVNHVEWAADSDHVLCACYKRGIIQCFSVKDEHWTCKIDEGAAGCVHARWSPSGTHVISVAEFHVRMSVWSLVDKSCVYVKAPKFDAKGIDFSADGKFLAMAERRDCKDAVTVISTDTWTIASHFTTATTDLANVKWSPDSTSIAVWDSAVDYLLLLYAPDGRLLQRYSPDPPRVEGGRSRDPSLARTVVCLLRDGGLGIKAVSWSPGGQLLAAGSFDQRCRVLNHVTWRAFAELAHPASVRLPSTCVVYKEVETLSPNNAPGGVTWNGKTYGAGDSQETHGGGGERGERAAVGGESSSVDASTISWWATDGSGGVIDDPAASALRASAAGSGRVVAKYVVLPLPASVPAVKASLDKPNPRIGVGLMAWSGDGKYLATRNDNMPTALWVWDMARLELAAVLLQIEHVKGAAWDPNHHRLAVVTGGERVYVWTPEGASFVQIPLPGFNATSVAWSPASGQFMLGDKDTFCCAYTE